MPTIRDRLREIYNDLDDDYDISLNPRFDELQEIIRELHPMPQQAVIRTRNGAVDDVVIDCDQVHLERMDDGVWSLILYRGEQKVMFEICWQVVGHKHGACTRLDAEVTEDTIGCEREEQGE